MKAITRPAGAIFLLLITLTTTAIAQQKRQTPQKPQPRAAAAPAPAPTFDTLVPADTYILYGEIRGVGQFIRSSSLNEILEPVLKLSGPPEDFRLVVKWLTAHAEEVMTSRLLLATWHNESVKECPDTIIAIEFATADEATKFAVALNSFLPKILPPSEPETSADTASRPDTVGKQKSLEPNFHLKRFGSLVVISPKPWSLKKLKPAGTKNLAEDNDFRAAHNRFNSEPVFLYVDTKTIAREEEERRRHWEQQRIEAQKQAESEVELKKEEEPPVPQPPEPVVIGEVVESPDANLTGEVKEETSGPDPFKIFLSEFSSRLFMTSEPRWPDGVGVALSYEGDSFDLRALLVNQTGEKADVIPFMPILMAGPAFTPEAANILPADTELLATMSLDLPQIFATISKPRPQPQYITSRGQLGDEKEAEAESPFAELEKRLQISIKDDLLPLLGPEIAIRLPLNNMGFIGLPSMAASTPTNSEEQTKSTPVMVIAIRDREAVRALMPKLIEAFAFKGASAFVQTERREDTELVSFANQFAYAFVGNFLVFSGNPATTRYVVDSYLKHETLAADIQFRNSTRWQPRPLQGQLYISPALMEGYRLWAEAPSTRISEQTRALLVHASSVAQPITYSLSNEGLGPLHEVHIPKSLILMAVAGISAESNPPETIQNERMAIGVMYSITYAETQFQKTKGNGSYGTLEQLIDAKLVSKESIERSGYRFEVILSGDKFEVSGVPVEYGKGGTFSLFIDNTYILRGADHNGASATSSDPPISN